jgi:[FeFe] hydrogenase H-cluster maturation GTPase HydF
MSKGKDTKPHIGIFGRRNNGKSSLINVLAGQEIAIVSDTPGTTTDPVKKSLEITGFGPVILIDTAGIDDQGALGEKRIAKSVEAIKQSDLAILVIAGNRFDEFERGLIHKFRQTDTPYIILYNKSDLLPIDEETASQIEEETGKLVFSFSAKHPDKLEELMDIIRKTIPEASYQTPSLLGDLLSYGDIVLLITPIDVQAPAGRLILPQVQAIRDILDNDCIAVVVKEREVDSFLRKTGIRPRLAITDSQVFVKADASIPRDIPLTSFSIMLARFKGDFESYLKGTPKISELKDGDKVLILESCTHHVSCDDIGRVKIPRWISSFTGKKLDFKVVTGLDTLPEDLNQYSLLVQCGGCVITRKQIFNRLRPAIEAGVPVTNYGMAIAYVQGIYNRAVAPFTGSVTSHETYL